MDNDAKRLLMRFEQMLRAANREVINPEIDNMSLEGLRPMVDLVARTRARYIKFLWALSKKYDGSESFPSDEEMKKLSALRSRYLELADGAKSVEICIERGYLDIK